MYIGQTTNERRRIDDHKNNNKKYNDHFHNAIRKYGWNAFEYKVLFRIYCSNYQDLKNTLDSKEIVAIKYFNSTDRSKGYNIKTGGSRGKPSRESIEKRRQRVKGKFVGEKNPFYGKHHTEESKRKMSASKVGRFKGENSPLFGKKYSKEEVEEMKPRLEKMWKSAMRPIVQLSLEGIFIKEWDSITEAAKSLGIVNSSVISQCCSKTIGRHQSHGFMWMYKEDYEGKLSSGEKIDNYVSPVKSQVVQLSLEGIFIRYWDSIADAGRSLGISKGCISECCIGETLLKSAGGFIWMFRKDYDSGKLPRLKLERCKRIVQLGLDGSFIKFWDSISEAESNLNISLSRFVKNNEGGKSSGGFMWMYEEDYEKYKDNIKPYKKICNRSIRIIQLDEKFNLIKRWNSIKEASMALGITQGAITSCIKNNRPHRIKRFRFMYEKDYENNLKEQTI